MGSVLSRESNAQPSGGAAARRGGSKFVPHRLLSEILESRAEELLGLIRDECSAPACITGLEAGVVLSRRRALG